MSCSKPHEKKENPSEDDTTTSTMERKVEMAQKFDKEMKDYAKATVKEFLGIYGYEDDVENISMEDSETPRSSATPVEMTTTNTESVVRNTQSAMSDCPNTNREDSRENPPRKDGSFVTEKSPSSQEQSDIIAYQSSGPISFVVVPMDSTEDTIPQSQITITKPVPSQCTSIQSEDVDEITSELPKSEFSLRRETNSTMSNLDKTWSGSSCNTSRVTMVSETEASESSLFVDESQKCSQDVHPKSETALVCYSSAPNPTEQSLIETAAGLSRKERNRLYKQMSRLRESSEKREARLARQRELARERRANEDTAKRGARLIKDRDRQRIKRSHEPEEVRAQRLIRQRLSARTRRLCETPEKKQARLSADKERSRRNRASKKMQVASTVVTSQG